MTTNLVIFGDEYGLQTLEKALGGKDNYTPKLIVYSSGRAEAKYVAIKLAEKYNTIALEQPSSQSPIYTDFVNQLSAINPTIGLCYSYNKLIRSEVLALFEYGIFNLHGALLPKYRGGNVLNWVLVNGEKTTGMTIHQMSNRIDAGPIAEQKMVKIADTDTAMTLREKLNRAALELLPIFWEKFNNNKIILENQIEKEATYVKRRKPEDGRFEWKQNAVSIYNLIRALVTPWPGAWYEKDGAKYVIDKYMSYDAVVTMREQMLNNKRML